MELKINQKNENKLLERQEIKFEAEHPNAPTPSRSEVLEELSSELGVSGDLIVIEKLATPHGHQNASGIARVYDSKDRLEEFESEYLVERTLSSGKAPEGEEEEVEEEPEEVEEPAEEEEEIEEKAEEPEEELEEGAEEVEKEPEEEEEAEEKREEPEEEEAEEPAEEEEVEGKEIDYQDISSQNISEIKEKFGESDLDPQKLLDAEKGNKNRKTLVEWLEKKIEAKETE